MLHHMPLKLALAALVAASPAPGVMDAAFAGSSSRSETRHNLTGDEEVEYDGELHTAANLYDALKEGYYGKF